MHPWGNHNLKAAKELRLRGLTTQADYEAHKRKVKQIQDMGFDLTQSVVGGVLQEKQGSMDRTIEALLELNLEKPAHEAPVAQKSPEELARERSDAEVAAVRAAAEARQNAEAAVMREQAQHTVPLSDYSTIYAETLKREAEMKAALAVIAAEEQQRLLSTEAALRAFLAQSTLMQDYLGKGLQNLPGENNCFLNVIIQSLYALPWFTAKFKSDEHFHDNAYCTFCALKIIFENYEYSKERQIPPTLLREAMAGLYLKDQKFQMGKYDDAAELYDALLTELHYCISGQSRSKSATCPPFPGSLPCFIHSGMSLEINQQLTCELCNKPSGVMKYSEFVHYIPAEALVSQVKDNPSFTMGQAVGSVEADFRPCGTEGCKGKDLPLQRTVEKAPTTLAIGLIWTTDKAEPSLIRQIMDVIDRPLNLSDIFHSAPSQKYTLRSVVCYYGLHYLTHIRVLPSQEWITFDDVRVKKISSEWQAVTEKCVSGHYQPFVLIFEAVQ